MIFLAYGRVERSPNVSLVSWGLEIEVVKAVKDRGPCECKILGKDAVIMAGLVLELHFSKTLTIGNTYVETY